MQLKSNSFHSHYTNIITVHPRTLHTTIHGFSCSSILRINLFLYPSACSKSSCFTIVQVFLQILRLSPSFSFSAFSKITSSSAANASFSPFFSTVLTASSAKSRYFTVKVPYNTFSSIPSLEKITSPKPESTDQKYLPSPS